VVQADGTSGMGRADGEHRQGRGGYKSLHDSSPVNFVSTMATVATGLPANNPSNGGGRAAYRRYGGSGPIHPIRA
jgi:hypothetical protein